MYVILQWKKEPAKYLRLNAKYLKTAQKTQCHHRSHLIYWKWNNVKFLLTSSNKINWPKAMYLLLHFRIRMGKSSLLGRAPNYTTKLFIERELLKYATKKLMPQPFILYKIFSHVNSFVQIVSSFHDIWAVLFFFHLSTDPNILTNYVV